MVSRLQKLAQGLDDPDEALLGIPLSPQSEPRASRKTFSYQSIRFRKSSFRLLRMRNVIQEQVECDLIVQTFRNGCFFPYQAISYVWGSTEKTHTILVNGAKLYVTKSLFELLLNLWQQCANDWLWIDGVCIDQDSGLEKNHQVQQMGRIYAAAERVVFYLGHSTANTSLLMKWLYKLDQFMRSTRGPDWYCESANRGAAELLLQVPPEPLHDFLSSSQRYSAAMEDLLTRPWFNRAWVIQEVGNAQDGLIKCGDRAASCRVFLLALKLLALRPSDIKGFRGQKLLNMMPTELRDSSFLGKNHGRNLLYLLKNFPYAEATCEEDRIYALLGLSGTDASEIQVDYAKPEAEIVQDTISHIYRGTTTKTLRLSFADIAVFLEAIEDLDYQVFNELVCLKDSMGVEVMLEDEHIGTHLLERFNCQLSRYGLERLLSSKDGDASGDRRIMKFTASNFDTRAEFVSYLMQNHKTRDLLWKQDGCGVLRSDCNIAINTDERDTMALLLWPMPPMTSPPMTLPPMTLYSHYVDFLTNAAKQDQVVFWFSGIRWHPRDNVFSHHLAEDDSSGERYCAGMMWHGGEGHARASLVDAICSFAKTNARDRLSRIASKKTGNKTSRSLERKGFTLEQNEIDKQLLREATEWYADDDVSLLSFQDADDPALWKCFERGLSDVARSCDGRAIRDDPEIVRSWLSLIVFPSSRASSDQGRESD